MNESLYNLKTLRSHGTAENVKITCHIDSVYNSLQMRKLKHNLKAAFAITYLIGVCWAITYMMFKLYMYNC